MERKLINRVMIMHTATYLLLAFMIIGLAVYKEKKEEPKSAEVFAANGQTSLPCPPITDMDVSAKAACLIDANSGTVLFNKNADAPLPMASTTKIMTALIVSEQMPTDTVITVPDEVKNIEGSSMYLTAGERITVEDLLYGLMLSSGNDAAYTLAAACAGNEEAFVEMMNEKAASLGLVHTHFDNPHGLPSDTHVTTAHELAMLTKYAMENETFRTVVSTVNKVVTSVDGSTVHYLRNHNKLLTRSAHVIGVKTGYTREAGRCLVSCAEIDGRRFIAVTLGAPDDWNDHTRLLDAAFDGYDTIGLMPKGTHIRIGVRRFVTQSGLSVTVKKGAAEDMKLHYGISASGESCADIECRARGILLGVVQAAEASGEA